MNDGQLPEGLEVVPLEAALQEVAIIERKKKKTRSSKSQAGPGAVVVNILQQKVSDSGDKSSHNDNNKPVTLAIGSDLEIAKRVHVDLERRFGRVLFAEGAFWHFASTHWESIHEDELRRAVHPYDGAIYCTPEGSRVCVRLGKARIESTLHSLITLYADRKFFNRQVAGINCASGFIRFSEDGTPTLEPQAPTTAVGTPCTDAGTPVQAAVRPRARFSPVCSAGCSKATLRPMRR